ncbi:hypothetical protein BGX30_008382, partial [Mortierella sp. GBA39]
MPERPDDRMAIIPLFQEEFSLAVRSDHPAARLKAIHFEQLKELDMVKFGPDRSCCQEKGMELHHAMVTSTLSTLLSMVEQGIGACILPRLLLDNLGREQITAVTLLHPTPSQEICIIYRTD